MLIIIFNLSLPFFNDTTETDFSEFKNEISQFRAERNLYNDSIRINRKQIKGTLTKEEVKKIIKPFKFDPNTLGKEGWLKMGFSSKQFRQINNYREKGGYFKIGQDLKKMYCISDVEFETIETFISIKKKREYVADKEIIKRGSKETYNKNTSKKEKNISKYSITELNSADSISLVVNLNIKPWLAVRVVKYRNMLGGYYHKQQLMEVYGFSENYFQRIESFIEVDTLLLNKIEINNIAFKVLLKHPYFDYETTKLIFNSKPKGKKKFYVDYYDFKQKTGITDSLSSKIRHYLYFGPPK